MPTLTALDDAMLHPNRGVPAVNRLGGGAIAMAGGNQPWRIVGATAAVYQLRQPSGRVLALRCPLADRPDPGLAERYRALATDSTVAVLRDTPGGPLVGGIAYLPDGLALPAPDLRSTTHPVIAMEWIMGPTLLAAADRACRADDRSSLAALGGSWLAATETLAAARFAHGELAADNVLVRPGGGIAVIDYDASTWPGSPPPVATRVPGYDHPTGGVPGDPARRDAFPALVIYASLAFLARRPDLREGHGDPPGRLSGALLFSAGDLQNPDGSPLFAALRALDEPDLKHLLGALRWACLGPVEDVPALGEVVGRPRRPPAPARSAPDARIGVSGAPAGAPAASRPTAAMPVPAGVSPEVLERQRRMTRLNSLLLAGDEEGAERFWQESGLADDADAARELGPRMAEITRRRLLREARQIAEGGDSSALLRLWERGGFEDFGPAAPLRPVVDAARRKAEMVDRLRAALDAGDAETVARLWPALRGDPIASSLAIRASAVLARRLGAAVARAVERGDDAATVAAVREAEAAGVAVEPSARRAARAALERDKTRRELQAAVAADDRQALATLAISGRLADLGRLEPDVMRCVVRALAWPHLERALAADDDAAILAAYDADLFDGALPPPQRARVDLARVRTGWLDAARAALRRRDVAALRAVMAQTPPGAEARLSRVERNRMERLTARDAAVERLATALREGPDTAIVEALERVEAAGATLPEALDWAAVRGVVDRVTLADAIRQAATAIPPDYARLARLLPAARAASASEGDGRDVADLGRELGFDFAQLEGDVLRAAHLARLRDALATDDDKAIAAAAEPDPYGALAQLTHAQRARVEWAVAARRGWAPLARRQ